MSGVFSVREVETEWTTVPRLPTRYPKQRGLTCGEANARSIIESFGIAYETPERPGLIVRLIGYSLLRDLRRLLDVHGLSGPIRSSPHGSDEERLAILRNHLDCGEPVILAIGNGHLRRGVYYPWARLLLGHYITLYGYNDVQRRFAIYDSYLDGTPREPIPAGNETRGYDELLRDWRGPVYYALVGRRHVYLHDLGARRLHPRH